VSAQQAADSLKGQAATPARIDEAAALASTREIDPMGNVHASPEYQRHLARVLTRRALSLALERALGS
jgi:carbon-monoxide dehydrogenase medium subunit